MPIDVMLPSLTKELLRFWGITLLMRDRCQYELFDTVDRQKNRNDWSYGNHE